MRLSLSLVVFIVAFNLAGSGENAKAVLLTAANRTALSAISAETIRAHMRFLSDDSLRGRDTGSDGFHIAARYAAAQFERVGAKPAGENDTYFQSVWVYRTSANPRSSVKLTAGDQEGQWVFGKDFACAAAANTAPLISAETVFVGYGIKSNDRDDYEGIDAKAKVVVMLDGAPEGMPATAGRMMSKTRAARDAGAVGIVVVVDSKDWTAWSEYYSRPRAALKRGEPPQTGRTGSLPTIIANAQSAAPIAKAGSSAKIEIDLLPGVVEEIDSPNVIAKVEGSDPKLKNEYVIYTAHLDHIGLSTPVDGDHICNGALDNASGTAILLSVAEAYAKLKPAPKRTMVFLLVMGEERGFWGSNHYVRNPIFPLSKTTANINIDMPAAWKMSRSMIVNGSERSSLKAPVELGLQAVDLVVDKDPWPSKRYFYRSDQIVFARAGVPAFYMEPGFKWVGMAEKAAMDEFEEWERTRYHQVGDEMLPHWDYQAFRKVADAAFIIGQSINRDTKLASWNEGDEFEKARKESIAQGK